MQLKRLEAYGFKSFADKLEIEFDKGITAIVGPNGSGKSNITDAIRWVLGEQNVRNLRGSKAEDIIFTGSATRRAMGVAEVSLAFDNSDGQLALDFKEIVVTRRLFRSGESEFYINKAKCRLKDIYELFADTGLGRDAISVISQNKIDEVLNSRPEERRLLFEETAGITKYRTRKRESLRKLDDTEQNLLRVQDILGEIENQLEPLAAQAEKTRQYNALQQEYRDGKLTQLLHKYEKCSWEIREGQKKLQHLRDEELASAAQVQVLEAGKAQLDQEVLEVEKSLKLLGEKNYELGQKIDRNNSEIAILQERVKQSGLSQQRLDIDKAEILQRQLAARDQLAALEDEKVALEAKSGRIEAQLQKELALEQSLQGKIRAQSAALKALQENSQRRQQEISEKNQALALLARDLEEKQRVRQEQEKICADSRQHAGQEQKELAVLETEAAAQTEKIHALQAKKGRLQQQAVLAQKDWEAAEAAIRQRQQDAQNAETRRRVLVNLQQEYEGFGRAVKAVLRSSQPFQRGIGGAVAELIQVDKAYVTAIEIALGASLQHVVTEDEGTAKAAIAFLKKERLGRVTFLPLSSLVVRRPAADPQVTKAAGFVGYASELVQTDAKYRTAVDFLLARTIVIDTVDNALQLAKRQGYKSRIVTLGGEVLNPGGSMAGGSSSHRESSFLNRSGEIEELTARIGRLQAELQTAEASRELAAGQRSGIASELQAVVGSEQAAAVLQAEQKIYIEKKTAVVSELLAAEAAATARIEALAVEEVSLSAQARTLETDLAGCQREAADAAGDEAAEMLEDLQQDYNDLSRLLTDRRIEKTVAEQELIRAAGTAATLVAELERCAADLEKNKAEAGALVKQAEDSRAAIGELEKTNEGLQALKAIAVKDHDNYYKVKMEKIVALQKNDRETKQAARQHNESLSRIHAFELELTKFEFERTQCEEEMAEDYQMDPQAAAGHKLPLPLAEVETRIRQLEAKLRDLGTVNPNAIEEYEALRTRHDFLQKQSQDLITAKEYLNGIIAEIDATMSKQFKAAFAEISGHFSEIFIRLFGGGQAKLLLTDASDVLSSGVEIEVQPPEKKLQNLSVLSGGERALTVIALLFAFLKYRPAPFSVVDEIDAPLDEANVNRFGSFLQEYAEQTQFIVVTHRKGTMEAARAMFGVTVEDAGVSRIVSVRLEDQLN